MVGVIEQTDGTVLSLDLTNGDVGTALGKASNQTDIRAIFDKFGGKY